MQGGGLDPKPPRGHRNWGAGPPGLGHPGLATGPRKHTIVKLLEPPQLRAISGSSHPRQIWRGWGTDQASGVGVVGRMGLRAQAVQPHGLDEFNMPLGCLSGSQPGKGSWQLSSRLWMAKMEKKVTSIDRDRGGNAHGIY